MASLSDLVGCMSETPASPSRPDSVTPTAPGPDDPRYAFAVATDAVGKLIEAIDTSPESLARDTPCEEFTLRELLDHVVMVMRRAAAVGRGEHFATVQQESIDGDWAAQYRSGAHAVMEAWTDPQKLGQMFEVPWGMVPGGAVITTYTSELAVHGWDIATATDADFTIADDVLANTLEGVKFVPAEGRDDPEKPFGPVVDPGPDASTLEQIAGWLGRPVGG